MFTVALVILPKTETQMSFRVREQQTAVHPYNIMLLSNKKEQIIETCNDLDESQRHFE